MRDNPRGYLHFALLQGLKSFYIYDIMEQKAWRVVMERIVNKVKAVMLGHAVADALGVPVEFMSRYELDKNPVTDMRGFGTYPVPKGSWSDDSSMALATLDSLASGEVDFDDIMERFCAWYYNNEYTPTGKLFDVGNSCAQAINNYFLGKRPATKCGVNGNYSNGNGSLMRIHPILLYAYAKELSVDRWVDLVAQCGCLTHAHERSEIGCGIYAFILMHLLESPERESVFRALREAKEFYGNFGEFSHYSRLFDDGFEKLSRSDIKSSGYVVDSLEAAVWCLVTTDNYHDCVLRAVNLGEDTDTVGAIAGGLAGALYGYEVIPDEWLSALLKRDYIEEMCERACKSWKK